MTSISYAFGVPVPSFNSFYWSREAYYLLQAVSTKFGLTIKLSSFDLFWNAEHLHPKDSYPELICQWTDSLQPLYLGVGKGEREVIYFPETYSTWASHMQGMSHSFPLATRQNRSRCLTALWHSWSYNISQLISDPDPGPGLCFNMVKTCWSLRSVRLCKTWQSILEKNGRTTS